jgi:ApbE superfamily uncharacterized protein (UPF0280 family)
MKIAMRKKTTGGDMAKSAAPHNRAYRRFAPRPGERRFQVVVEQSDLWITVRSGLEADLEALALDRLNAIRGQLKSWMLLDPSFGPSLVPLPVPESAPEIIQRMCRAAAVMHVGPMACVAGAVAAAIAETLLPFSPDCLVENGGDSMLHSTCDRVVGLLSDPAADMRLGLALAAGEFPLSLCASSSFIGHSFSLGKGDLAVVRAKDACLADAAATAFCNMLQGPEDTEKAAERAAAQPGIDGLFVQCAGRIAVWGKMELVAISG